MCEAKGMATIVKEIAEPVSCLLQYGSAVHSVLAVLHSNDYKLSVVSV